MEQIVLDTDNSKPFRSIIHLADLHIRSGDIYRSKYHLYESTFNRLIERISQETHVITGECLTVIAGDIFHYKNEADSTGIQLFNHLIGKLSDLCPVLIIQGNHDYKQGHLEEPGILDSLFHCIKRKNVYFLDRSANYIINNLGIGVISVKDVLDETKNSGQKEILPIYHADFNPSVNTKIALFHGSITGGTLQNYQEITDGYKLSWIQGYDLGLFGDIHMQQIHNIDPIDSIDPINCTEFSFGTLNSSTGDKDLISGMPWGYPGSLIQQNYGERLFGHGYLYWDLNHKTVHIRNIKSDSGMTYLIRKDSKWMVSEGKWNTSREERQMDILQLFQNELCPSILNVIIRTKYTNSEIQELFDLSNMYSIQIIIQKGHLQKYLPENADDDHWEDMNGDEIDGKNDNGNENDGISNDYINVPTELPDNYNDPKAWIQYIQQNGKTEILESTNWSQWLINPEILINDDMTDDEKKVFTKQLKLINTGSQLKLVITIQKLEWSNLFCYGEGNYIDFMQMKNKICLIEGNNSTGKSSLFDILFMSIYNTQIPSRATESMKNIINYKCIKGSTKITYKIGQEIYEIERIYKRNLAKNSIDNNSTVYYYKDQGTPVIYSEKDGNNVVKTKTKLANEIAERHFGKKEKFLTAIMLTQTNDATFFDLKYSEQICILDGAVDTKIITDVQNFLKIAKNYYNRRIKEYERRVKNTIKQIEHDVQEISEDKLNVLNTGLQNLHDMRDGLNRDLQEIPEMPPGLTIQDLLSYNDFEFLTCIQKIQEIQKIQKIQSTDGFSPVQIFDDLKNELSVLSFKQTGISFNPNIVVAHTPDDLDLKIQQHVQKLGKYLNICTDNDDDNDWAAISQDFNEESDLIVLHQELDTINLKINVLIDPGRPSETEMEYQSWNTDLKRCDTEICTKFLNLDTLVQFTRLQIPEIDVSALNVQEKELEKDMQPYLQWYNLSDQEITDLYQEKTKIYNEETCMITELRNKFSHLKESLCKYNQEFTDIDVRIRSLPIQIKPNRTETECQQEIQKYQVLKADENDLKESLKMILIKIKKHILYQQMIEDYQTLLKETVVLKCTDHYHSDCQSCNHDPKLKRERDLNNQLQILLKQEIQVIPDLKVLEREEEQIILDLQEIEHFPILSWLETIKNWQEYHKGQTVLNGLNIQREDLNRKIISLNQEIRSVEIDLAREQNVLNDISTILKSIDYIYDHSGKWAEKQVYIREQRNLHLEVQKFNTIHKISSYTDVQSAKSLLRLYQDLVGETEKWDRYLKSITKYQEYLKIVQNYQELQRGIKYKIGITIKSLRFRLKLYQQESNNIQYTCNQQRIEFLKGYINDLTLYNKLNGIKNYLPFYQNKKDLSFRLRDLQGKIEIQTKLFGEYSEKLRNQKEFMIMKQKEEEEHTKNQKMYQSTEHIETLMSMYGLYIRQNILLPRLNRSVNLIANRVLPMDSEFEGIENDKQFRWLVRDKDGNVVHVNLSGGYRCFVYNLALRISMSRIGCSIVNCNQLIIDEGFVAASEENQEKVEPFLRAVLSTQNYQTIILASHLKTIKKVADIIIPIQINSNTGTSMIQYHLNSMSGMEIKTNFINQNENENGNENENEDNKCNVSSLNSKSIPLSISKKALQRSDDLCHGIKVNGGRCIYKMAKGYEPYCKRHKKS